LEMVGPSNGDHMYFKNSLKMLRKLARGGNNY
jgi:hypothetical protein